MGQLGRITTLGDLPSRKKLVAYVKKAKELNDAGVKVVRKTKPKPALETPADLLAALKKNKKANATFENFPPSHRREYVEWIVDAKTDETRQRRLAQDLPGAILPALRLLDQVAQWAGCRHGHTHGQGIGRSHSGDLQVAGGVPGAGGVEPPAQQEYVDLVVGQPEPVA